MTESICITMLVENTVRSQGLLAEHGLAYWIETPTCRILFDTGQGSVLSHNAKILKVPLKKVDKVVLSHGHYDHTGGLPEVLRLAHRPQVYLHPLALAPRYSKDKQGKPRRIGIPILDEKKLRKESAEIIWTRKVTEVTNGIFVTGEVPRLTEFEDTGGAFYLDEACQEIDCLPDDQSLFFPSPHGTVVLLGCAHSGVVNTLGYIQKQTNNAPIYTVIGGMHLVHATQDRIDQTIQALRDLQIERMAPIHCTSEFANTQMWAAFPGQCFSCDVGTVINFDNL